LSGFLDKNLALLASSQPETARQIKDAAVPAEAVIETTRSGLPGLKTGRVRLCSTVDPQAEGRSLAARALPGKTAVFGFGLGYHLEPLAHNETLVYEPDAGLLKLALDARDFSGLLPHIQLECDLSRLDDMSGYSPLVHRPTARLHPAELEGFKRRLAEKPQTKIRPENPRVLVVPPILGGTLAASYWSAEALGQLGCRVETIPIDKMAPLYDLVRKSSFDLNRLDQVREPMIRFLSELTLMKAEEFQPHMVMALAQAPLQRKVITQLRGLGAVTVFWFVEDFRLMTYFREVASAYDHFFHIQGEEMAHELNRLGANYSHLPVAAHPPCHRPLSLSPEDKEFYGAKVGFMGAGYPNRRRIFGELVENGFNIKLWGVDWPEDGPLGRCLAKENRYLESDEVVKIYNACRIVLNLHSSPRKGQRIGGADFVNPRTLEVPCCGGFQLVDHVPVLNSMLKPGKEVAVFTSKRDLLDKVRHYLDYPDQRAAIARAGRLKVLDQHTYCHRMETMLNLCLGPVVESGQSRDEKIFRSSREGVSDQAARLLMQNLMPATV
jgi:spore maturation protein CgeB